jgi:acetyltransferase
VAETTDGKSDRREILGVGRLTRNRDTRQAEVAVLIADRCQNVGLGTELLARLIDIARAEKLERIVAHTLAENAAMRGLGEHFGFRVVPGSDPSEVTTVLDL